MNEILEQFKQTLIQSWNTTDKARLDDYKKYCEEHKGEKFDDRWSKYKVDAGTHYERTHDLTKHEIFMIAYGFAWAKEENEKAAERFVKTLEERIKGVVGEIQSITTYSTENGGGWQVIGTTGKANVIQIYAGGYNIQRLHIRNLIKKVK